MSWTIRIFVLHLLRSAAARLLLGVYAVLVIWWNLAVPVSTRADMAVLATIELDWPRWLVYAWLLVTCTLRRARNESFHLLASNRSPTAAARPVRATRGLRLGSWGQLRLSVEAASLFLLASLFTVPWVALRSGMFHVEPLLVGALLALAATLQVSAIVSVVGEGVFAAWLCGALIAIAEVWQGRIGTAEVRLGLGLVLIWAGVGLVLVGFEAAFRNRSIEKASV